MAVFRWGSRWSSSLSIWSFFPLFFTQTVETGVGFSDNPSGQIFGPKPRKLSMRFRQLLIPMFTLALFACVASCARASLLSGDALEVSSSVAVEEVGERDVLTEYKPHSGLDLATSDSSSSNSFDACQVHRFVDGDNSKQSKVYVFYKRHESFRIPPSIPPPQYPRLFGGRFS